MRRTLLLSIVAACTATPIAAQIGLPSSPYHAERWSFGAAFGSTAAVGGSGAKLTKKSAAQGGLTLRHRLRDSRWWIGLDMDVWIASATPAGVDSLVARSGIRDVYSGNGGDFGSAGFAVSVRYDAWRMGPVLGYGVASVGANNSGGYLRGKCTDYPNPCEFPAVNVKTPGMHPSAMAGFGVLVHWIDTRGIWTAIVPSRIFAEARIANQGTYDGRLTSVPLLLGLSW